MGLAEEVEQYEAEEYKALVGPREPVAGHQESLIPRVVEETAGGRAVPARSLGLWQHPVAPQWRGPTEAGHNRDGAKRQEK